MRISSNAEELDQQGHRARFELVLYDRIMLLVGAVEYVLECC